MPRNAFNNGTPKTAGNNMETVAKKMDKLVERLDAVEKKLEKFTATNEDILQIKESMHFMNSLFENLKQTVESTNRTVDIILQKNELLKQENESLKWKVDVLQESLIDLQQYSRRLNIEVNGVPEGKNEDCTEIVLKIATASEINISENDIEIAHRVSTKSKYKKHKPIVVKFKDRKLRDKVLKEAKRKKLTARDIGYNNANDSLFLNEHLCPDRKKLFHQALQRKKDFNWKYIWTSQGQIKVRKNDDTDIVHVNKHEDLDKIN